MRDEDPEDLALLDSESPIWLVNYKNKSMRFPTQNDPRLNLFFQLVMRDLDKFNS